MPHNLSSPDDPFAADRAPIDTSPPTLEPNETEKQQDTLFNASLKQGLISNVGLLAPRKPEITPIQEATPWAASAGAVFESMGIANSVLGGSLDFSQQPLQDISLGDLERDRPDLWEALQEGITDPESPRGRPRNVILRDFRSYADLDQRLLILQEAEERLEIMSANGISASPARSGDR